jgi:hypothetical protein
MDEPDEKKKGISGTANLMNVLRKLARALKMGLNDLSVRNL